MKSTNPFLPIRITLLVLTLTWAGFQNSEANADMREWKFTSGQTRKAELMHVDEVTHLVHLRSEKGEEFTTALDLLSPLDRAWVLEWSEMGDELVATAKKLGGTFEHIQGRGATTVTDFYVYHPLVKEKQGPLPMMILFDAGGKGQRYLLRHVEAAQAVGMTVIGCDMFQNSTPDDAALTRFRELLPIICNSVPHDQAGP